MPTEGIAWLGTFAPFFTSVTDDLADIGIAPFIFKMKVLRAAMSL